MPSDLDAGNKTAVCAVSSEIITLGDVNFCMHEWSSKSSSNNNNTASNSGNVIVIIFHGFLAHGLYPTVRYAAEFLSNSSKGGGYTVVAPDLRGHGQSSGLAGYLPSADIVLQDGVAIVEHVAQKYAAAANTHQHPKIVLLGSSMGGTIALQVAMKIKEKSRTNNDNKDGVSDSSISSSSSSINIAGVILLAPMLKLGVDFVSRNILYHLAQLIPTWCIIPSSNSTSGEKQYRDAAKRQECESDPHVGGGSNNNKIRVASASTCVELAGRMQQDDYNFCKSVDIAFFLGVADEDVVVDNQGSFDLYRESVSNNKTMKRYPALHGLLCEPSPLFETIQDDILEWIRTL